MDRYINVWISYLVSLECMFIEMGMEERMIVWFSGDVIINVIGWNVR